MDPKILNQQSCTESIWPLAFSRITVNRLQRFVVSSVSVAFVCLLGLLVFALVQRQAALRTSQISNSQALAALALTEMDEDPELSVLLARQSIRVTYQENRTVLPLSNTALRESIIKSRIRLVLKGHGDEVWSVSYSPGGRRIVTGSFDKTAKVWDAQTSIELMTLTSHEGRVSSAVYSAVGKRIATAGDDDICRIYTTDMDELLQIAESRITRQLTAEEKEKYGVLDWD